MKKRLEHSVSELEQQLEQGQISRRDFLRSLALLGLSLGVGQTAAGCSQGTAPEATPHYQGIINDPGFGDATPGPAPTSPFAGQVAAGSPDPAESALEPDSQAGAALDPTSGRKVFSWLCAVCGERFPNSEALERHTLKDHWRRLPEIRRVDEPTYTQFIVGPIDRFDERNTALCRRVWDKQYQAQIQEAAAKAPKMDLKRMEGEALVAGAIYVDDTAGSLNPSYYGYNGHQQEGGGLYSWDEAPNPERYPVDDPAWMSRRIKQVARVYGADLVGITKVDPRWVYSRYFEASTGNSGKIEIPYRYAIVMGIEMDWKWINESPGLEASAAAALGYSRMAQLTASLAKYIRMLGYPAVPSGNDSAQSIPLAIDAGLGELGRNGLLLSPEFGPRQRLCKVFTDLPLEVDQPVDFGIQSYCETCHACATSCPVNSIQSGDRTTEITSISNRKGLLRWPVDTAGCYLFWVENGTDCGNCIAACPWAIQNPRDWLEFKKQ